MPITLECRSFSWLGHPNDAVTILAVKIRFPLEGVYYGCNIMAHQLVMGTELVIFTYSLTHELTYQES